VGPQRPAAHTDEVLAEERDRRRVHHPRRRLEQDEMNINAIHYGPNAIELVAGITFNYR